MKWIMAVSFVPAMMNPVLFLAWWIALTVWQMNK